MDGIIAEPMPALQWFAVDVAMLQLCCMILAMWSFKLREDMEEGKLGSAEGCCWCRGCAACRLPSVKEVPAASTISTSPYTFAWMVANSLGPMLVDGFTKLLHSDELEL